MSPEETIPVPAPAKPPVSSTEFRLFLAICFFFAGGITLPHLWAWTVTPEGYVWGGLIWKTFDPNVHLAWARQAQDGHFFFRDLFTNESLISGEKPLFFNLLPEAWGLLGHTGIPIIFWFHLTRVVGGIWALWEFSRLSRLVLTSARDRIIALWLVALATGSSFLTVLWPRLNENFTFIDHPEPTGNFPTMPEAFLFTSAFAYPLNVVAYGLLALLVRKVLATADGVNRKDLITAFVGALLLSNIHTYDAIPLGLTLVLWLVLSGRKEKPALKLSAAVLLGLALPIAYQVVVFGSSEEFRVKALTLTLAPAFRNIFVSMAFLLVPGILGAAILFQKTDPRQRRAWLLTVTWAAVTLFSIYLPVSFARKMLEGAQFPLALLAAGGYGYVAGLIRPPSVRYAAGLGFGLLLSLAPWYFVDYCLDLAAINNSKFWPVMMPPHYLRKSEWDALQFLNRNRDEKVAVLSMPHVGVYGPRETGMTFYLSHWAETLHFGPKINLTSAFYGERMSLQDAGKFLHDNKIRFVLDGWFERSAGTGSSQFAREYGLKPVWTEGEGDNRTTVYEVPAAAR